MSASLVRKGLELLADEFEDQGDQQVAVKKNKRKGPSSMKKDDLMKHISTNKQGVKKQLRQLKRKDSNKYKPTVMGKTVKSAIDTYYSKKRVDHTDLNVQCLLKADKVSTSVNTITYEKIMKHSRGRLAKDNPTTNDDLDNNDTLFTDEDFELFEEEYKPS